MSHQLRTPLCNAVNRHTAPIMSTDDDTRDAELGTQSGDSEGMGFEAKVPEVVGGLGAAIAHAVKGDASESKRREQWDLIAPGEGNVWKAVDEESSAFMRADGWRVEVV